MKRPSSILMTVCKDLILLMKIDRKSPKKGKDLALGWTQAALSER